MQFSQRSYVCFLLVQNEYFTTEVFSMLNFSNNYVHIILKDSRTLVGARVLVKRTGAAVPQACLRSAG